jgi:hypothetical protein
LTRPGVNCFGASRATAFWLLHRAGDDPKIIDFGTYEFYATKGESICEFASQGMQGHNFRVLALRHLDNPSLAAIVHDQDAKVMKFIADLDRGQSLNATIEPCSEEAGEGLRDLWLRAPRRAEDKELGAARGEHASEEMVLHGPQDGLHGC